MTEKKCEHSFILSSYDEKYYPPHSGHWKYASKGHSCCGQCKVSILLHIGKTNCDGECRGVCNIIKLRTISRTICTKCGIVGSKLE